MTTAQKSKSTAAKSTAAAKADEVKGDEAQTAAPTTGGLGFALKVERAAVTEIKRAAPKRVKEDNPTEEAVKHSRENGEVLAFSGLPDEEALKKVTGLLRRAASDAGHGIQLQSVQAGDGTWTINFKSVDKKRERQYTSEQIRAWARENGYPQYSDAKLKITNDVREAFKDANGFVKKSKKTSAK